MFDTPILFLVFNRPDCTKRVFDAIREIKPKFLFIAADGPRSGNDNDKLKCHEVKNLILKNIDWECELKTLFRESNLGCGRAVSEAITWFFQNVNQGIILEDDCLPNSLFFSYCEEMLLKYKDDDRIFSVSGFNFGFNTSSNFASRFMNMWGWATWKRSAMKIDYEMKTWHKKSRFQKQIWIISRTRHHVRFIRSWMDYWILMFDNTSIEKKENSINTWDYQWIYHCLEMRRLVIFPQYNYVQNLGFGNEFATHTISENKIMDIMSDMKKSRDQKIISADLNFELECLLPIWCGIESYSTENIFNHLFKNISFYAKKTIKGLLLG